MGKLAQATSKYVIYAQFDAEGMVEKPDVIGAVFGQTEGLLGQSLDLRELQRTGRIGRIDVHIESRNAKARGVITIPSSLDASETALIAACIETIERVGPCSAKLTIEKVEDVRIEKRNYVIERAKDILKAIYEQDILESEEITEKIKEELRAGEVVEYRGLPAGPNVESSDTLIICEGRADIVTLLKAGMKNVIAIEGTNVPEVIGDISRGKTTIAFLDGDRGGDLILKELSAHADIDFVARAPDGKEVEELTKKEIFKAVRDKVPFDQAKPSETTRRRYKRDEYPETEEKEPTYSTPSLMEDSGDKEKKEKLKGLLDEITGTRAAILLDENLDVLGKVPAAELESALENVRAASVLIDGSIDQDVVDKVAECGAKYLVGMKLKGRIRPPQDLRIYTAEQLS
ncbi:MAG TPA: DNA primase DnaG [archaeon]|nr:DNA primase DnaG [archaeon]